MDVIVVCRANVCRSRVAEGLLSEPLRRFHTSVTAAGVDAADPDIMCPDAAAFLKIHEQPYADQPPLQLTADMVRSARLVLTADREVTTAVAALCPSARPRIFRLLWAATAMTYVAGFVAARDVPPGAAPLPAALEDRWGWMVDELDAARGQLPAPGELGGDAFYDVRDPHAEAIAHADALDRIESACEQIARSAYVVLDTAVLSPV